MREFPSAEIKDKWGAISEVALQEPITITKRGRPSLVMMSNRDFESLRKSYFSGLNARLEEGIRAADNGEFTSLTVKEIRDEAAKLFEADRV